MRSDASTPEEYLDELPPDRRTIVSQVRDLVKRNLPRGYQESMNWGMITWEIPLERYPDTYNDQPLAVAALAAQKNHYALYLHGVYMEPDADARLRERFRAAGKKLDMGKSCVRFKRIEDLDLDAIADVVAGTTPDDLIAMYEAARGKR